MVMMLFSMQPSWAPKRLLSTSLENGRQRCSDWLTLTHSLLGATFVEKEQGLNADQGLSFWIKVVNIRMKELTADEDRDVPDYFLV